MNYSCKALLRSAKGNVLYFKNNCVSLSSFAIWLIYLMFNMNTRGAVTSGRSKWAENVERMYEMRNMYTF